MPRYDWILQYRNREGSWEAVATPKGALDNLTFGQASAYLGQFQATHPNLVSSMQCLGKAVQ